MRAEEMNVVDAAIAYYQDDSAVDNHNALMDAVRKLIFSCPQCNTDRHICPGCGESISHFEALCGRCEDDSTALQHETPEESAAIVDANLRAAGSSGLEGGTNTGKVEHRMVNTIERLRELTVIRAARDYVNDNPPGPVEPMQDKAVALRAAVEELALWHGSDTHLLADLDQERYEISGTDQEMIDQEEALNPDQEPEYVPAEWQHVLAGDRVRLGAQEAEVTRSSVGVWHADNSDRYRPRPWKHAEVSISLAHLDRPLVMAPGGPVEILADRERAAVLVLQKAFPAAA